jgi:hypothetical protein
MFSSAESEPIFPVKVSGRGGMLTPWENCKAYNKARHEYTLKMPKQFTDEIALTENTTDPESIGHIVGDNILSALFHGQRDMIPYSDAIVSHVEEFTLRRNNQTYSEAVELAQLVSSDFFEHLLQQFDSVINGTSTLRYSLYSAHDVTTYTFLTALLAFDGQPVPYASALLFELH